MADVRCKYCNWLNRYIEEDFICRNCNKKNIFKKEVLLEEDSDVQDKTKRR